MDTFLLIVNIIVSAVIVGLILMQGRGAGLGSAWGGSGEGFQSRRGVEKLVLQLTVICIVIFFIISAIKLVL